MSPTPNLVFIGAQDTATTWLRSSLANCRDVHISDVDLKRVSDLNAGHLARLVADDDTWTDQSVVGITASGALLKRSHPTQVAASIDGAFPEATLVAVLRNPTHRACAAFRRMQANGRIPGSLTFGEYIERVPPHLDANELLSAGEYAKHLSPFILRFGSRLVILIDEQLRTEPRVALDRVLFACGSRLRAVPQPIAIGPPMPDVPPPELATHLANHFAGAIAQLEELLGCSLDCWR